MKIGSFIVTASIAATAMSLLSILGISNGLADEAPAVGAAAMPVVNPADFKWKPKDPLPPGAFAAVVNGDPHVGGYDFFGKFPAKYTVPMHWHTNDVMVVMMQGSMVIGRDKQPSVEVKQGGFFLLPAALKYTAHCDKECIFLAHGPKAFDIFYANPKDDPRTAAATPKKK